MRKSTALTVIEAVGVPASFVACQNIVAVTTPMLLKTDVSGKVDPYPRGNSLLWRHPVIEADAIIRIAEAGTERLWRRDSEVMEKPIAFIDRAWQEGQSRSLVSAEPL